MECCSVSVELESPVVVVPVSAESSAVLVAHLGRMSLANRPGPPAHTAYTVRLRDIALATVRSRAHCPPCRAGVSVMRCVVGWQLDVAEKLKHRPLTAESMEDTYDVSAGKPVLHDTALQLTLDYCDKELDGEVVYQVQMQRNLTRMSSLHKISV